MPALTSRQFAEWKAYESLEPWGEGRADLRAGIISATIANWAGKSMKDGAAPARPADFMPYEEKPKPAGMTAADLRASLAHRVVRKTETE